MPLTSKYAIALNRFTVNCLVWFIISEEKSVTVNDSFICFRFFQKALTTAITHTKQLILKINGFVMVATMLLLYFPPYLNGL